MAMTRDDIFCLGWSSGLLFESPIFRRRDGSDGDSVVRMNDRGVSRRVRRARAVLRSRRTEG
jgi:hypothetical protein